jgi:hypothetical protein
MTSSAPQAREEPDGAVQAQLGPDLQEMGGLWPGAASALANCAAPPKVALR